MVETKDLQNRSGEMYRCRYNPLGHSWYAYSIDVAFHITKEYVSLSDALTAGDAGQWLPLLHLAEVPAETSGVGEAVARLG